MRKNLIIAHGGGPTAVINASLYGVIKEAEKVNSIERVYGAVHGIEGVLNEHFIDLTNADADNIDMLTYTPASAIGSCRRKLTEEDYPVVMDIFKRHNIGYFIYNGGNDSMDTCDKVNRVAREAGMKLYTFGIPKTIDNDLAHTDHCPGFGSAARFVASVTRDLWCEVKALPIYVTILETMGRNAGWLAAAASLAKINDRPCAQLIYLPETAFDKDRFFSDVSNRLSRQKELLIVVSEGLAYPDGKLLADTGFVDGFGHPVPGGTAQAMARMLLDDMNIKTRAERPGLIGRALSLLQSTVDRDEAIACGRYAVKAMAEGKTDRMVSIVRQSNDPYAYSLEDVPLSAVANHEKTFPLEWITENKAGITKEFEEYCKPLIGEDFPAYSDFDSYYKAGL